MELGYPASSARAPILNVSCRILSFFLNNRLFILCTRKTSKDVSDFSLLISYSKMVGFLTEATVRHRKEDVCD